MRPSTGASESSAVDRSDRGSMGNPRSASSGNRRRSALRVGGITARRLPEPDQASTRRTEAALPPAAPARPARLRATSSSRTGSPSSARRPRRCAAAPRSATAAERVREQRREVHRRVAGAAGAPATSAGTSWRPKTASNAPRPRRPRAPWPRSRGSARRSARASARLASRGPRRGRPRPRRAEASRYHWGIASSGIDIVLPYMSSGGSVTPDVVAERLGHLLRAVGADEQRRGHDDLRGWPYPLCRSRPISRLKVWSVPPISMSASIHGVPALKHRIQQLQQRDRLVGR